MKAQIKINLDNDIFQLGGGIELGRLLHSLAEDIENNNACNLGSYIPIIEINGNRVGEFEIVESENKMRKTQQEWDEERHKKN